MATTTTVTKPTLTYFNVAAKAEIARLILEEAAVDYDFVAINNWAEQKKELTDAGKLAFGQVPLYEEPGFVLVQSGAIVRYLAQEHGLSGSNRKEAAQIDSVYEGVIDFFNVFVNWKWRTEESKKEDLQQTILKETLPTQLGFFAALLEKNGNNGFIVGSKISYADLALYAALTVFHELPGAAEVISSLPTITKFHQAVANRDRIKAYIARNVYAQKKLNP